MAILKKECKTSIGNLDLLIPRDENSTFEPQIIKKHQTDISEMENKIIFMYSKGMSTRDINEYLLDIYGIEVSKDFISRITDKILPDIRSWQSRKLNSIYPIVYIDGIRFKVKEEGMFKEKSVYIAIGININGIKDVLGF